ncbi:MAG: iron-containing alcohol dehydrogenase, partial [Bacteroidales bacterium]|nr:iron-containing alcohol dehydrogenase [Bacteroidales bacterium]
LPPRQRANGVVDAFIHVTEQYLTYPADAKVQDRFAEGLLLTLIEEGPNYVHQPDDIDTASNVVWAATMALNGLIAAGVPEDWATHQIGHEITALEGLDHAQTLALVWPGLQKTMRASKREKLLQFADRIWNLRDGDEDRRIDEAIARTEAFFRSLGVGTRIADYPQLASSDFIDVIVERFRKRDTHLGERAEIDCDTVRRILEDRR